MNLAYQLRPQKLEEFFGQEHLVGPDKILRKMIEGKNLFSMILWGPPGSGKTTLAQIISNNTNSDFYALSAVQTGKEDLKKIVISAKENQKKSKNTILFIDEIHRWNKAQQDGLLPHVESGLITLIGATTENPSFEVINPLLSRTRVLVLNRLETADLREIVSRALKDRVNGLGSLKIKLLPEAMDFLIEACEGDARTVLNVLETASNLGLNPGGSGTIMMQFKIDQKMIEQALQKRILAYDKHGEEHHNTISAFIKSMRASNVDAALYYLARMVEAGEDPLFIARRMVIFASEDIGLAQSTALVVANEVFKACETIGYPECQINLAHGVAYLAGAKKDRSAYDAYLKALADVQSYGNLPIPLNLRNASTKLLKELGYGKGYEKYSKESLLPDKIKDRKYFTKEDKDE